MDSTWEMICSANWFWFLFLGYYPNALFLPSANFLFNSVRQFLLALKINEPHLISGIHTLLLR